MSLRDKYFEFQSNLQVKGKYTKRAVLSVANQIFDPFGLLIPVEMKCRKFLQKLWKVKEYGWDVYFAKASDLVTEWDELVSECQIALKARFPRKLEVTDDLQLHIFSDASKDAYGTVAYFVIPESTTRSGHSQIVCSKGKVAPLHKTAGQDTIPKLELMGLTMSAYMASSLLKVFSMVKFCKKVLWCDSKVVLDQCSSKNNKSPFVHNRVVNIRSLCADFEIRYVKSQENPADLLTKSDSKQFALEFLDLKLWWEGAAWVTLPELWLFEPHYNLFPELTPEFKDAWIVGGFADVDIPIMFMQAHDAGVYKVPKLWEFSTYRAVVKVFVILGKLLDIAKGRPFDTSGVITHNRFVEGERLMFKYMQQESFPTILARLRQGLSVNAGPFAQLKLYLDKYDIIRCSGRMNDAGFAEVNTHTLNVVRRDIHALKLRRQIREVLDKCLI